MSSDGEGESRDQLIDAKRRVLAGKRKRVQVESEDEDAADGEIAQDEQEDVDEDGNPIQRHQVERPTFIRASDGYISGSITRISLYNFMTYEKCTIRPGPSLNMIIGPNGTGKSTISSAIVLGLAFPPSLLGRSTKITSFIRLGQPFAEIEIELRGKDAKETVTVFRKFGMDKEHNEFKLNGEASTKQKVEAVVRELGIVANLCNYLPQDKVASFAAMSPEQLLLETMGAAGNVNLRKWHAELIEKGKTFDEISKEVEIHLADRNKEQTQVDLMRPEKEQFEARKHLEHRLSVAKTRLNMAQYDVLKQEYIQKKDEYSNACKQLDAERKRQAPLQAMGDVLSDKAKEVAEDLSEHIEKGKRVPRKMKDCRKAVDDKDNETSAAQAKLDSLKKNAKTYRGKLIAEEEKLERLESMPKPPQPDYNLEKTEKARHIQLKASIREKQNESTVVDQKINHQSDRAGRIQGELTDLQKQITQAKSAKYAKQDNLCRRDASVAFAIQWLENHKDKLHSEVFLPPLISAEVTDRKLANQVEACLTMKTRNTFICIDRRDFQTMSNLIDTPMPNRQKCRIHLAHQMPGRGNQQPPISEEVLAQAGLDGVASDFISAPEPVLDYLCQNANLQRKGVTTRRDKEVNEAGILQLRLESYVTAEHLTTFHTSNYGGGSMFDTRTYKPAAFLVHSIDEKLVSTLENKMKECQDTRRGMENEIHEMRKSKGAIEKKVAALEEEMKSLVDAAAARMDAARRYKKAQQDIAGSKDRISLYREKMDNEGQTHELKKGLATAATIKLKEVLKYNALFFKDCENAEAIIRLGLQQCQSNVNRDAVLTAFKDKYAQVQELTERVATLKIEKTDLRDTARQCGDAATTRVERFGKRRQEVVDEIAHQPIMSLAEEQEALTEAQAELDGNIGVDPGIMERYEKHFEMLQIHIASVTKLESAQAKARKILNDILANFRPALDDLISVIDAKFSTFFEALGCSGKVELDVKGDDYARWGILIHVRFRDEETMQVLTASRQSGGERALSTIAYLMSLTDMARVPFSLVDEINQGMDKRAERVMHNTLVQVTCQPNSGQYFLITPKLLCDLDYHPRMTVLNVFNGAHMSKGAPNAGNLRANLANYRKRMRR